MRINDNRPVDRTARVKRVNKTAAVDAGATVEVATTSRSVEDVATFLGIPEAELTPNVHRGLSELLLEVDRLRQDLEARDRRIAYLERLADEDPLTPLLNRRAFVRELSRMMAYAERYGVTSSVLYFDVNDMKRINDVYGHSAGDAVLTHVASALLANVRSSDVVGRLGGDEFGVLLAQTGEQNAATKGADLAAAVQATTLTPDGHGIEVTVSFGVFTFDGRGEPQEVLDAADRKMYSHKQQKKPHPHRNQE